jgi:glycerol kinase
MAGDQHAALFGQACFAPGDVKNTYGTGCFMLMNTGNAPVSNDRGLLSTMAWRIGGKPVFALEGSVFVAGAAIQWLRDELGILKSAAESEELAAKVPDTGGVCFVPAFTGLGAPYWNMYARGTLVGITRGTNRHHLARAALESIAFQSDDLLRLMAQSFGQAPGPLRVDGGASANNLLMQLQSDISGVRILRPMVRETTALGAALLAGIAVGMFAGPREAAALRPPEHAFKPRLNQYERETRRACWENAVKTALFEAGLREGSPCS